MHEKLGWLSLVILPFVLLLFSLGQAKQKKRRRKADVKVDLTPFWF